MRGRSQLLAVQNAGLGDVSGDSCLWWTMLIYSIAQPLMPRRRRRGEGWGGCRSSGKGRFRWRGGRCHTWNISSGRWLSPPVTHEAAVPPRRFRRSDDVRVCLCTCSHCKAHTQARKDISRTSREEIRIAMAAGGLQSAACVPYWHACHCCILSGSRKALRNGDVMLV